MISFAATENCVKWQTDTCAFVKNKQKCTMDFSRAYNALRENKCAFLENALAFGGNIQNEDKCGAFVLVWDMGNWINRCGLP